MEAQDEENEEHADQNRGVDRRDGAGGRRRLLRARILLAGSGDFTDPLGDRLDCI